MTDSQTLARQANGAVAKPKRELTIQMVADMSGFSVAEATLILKTSALGAPLIELALFLHSCQKLKLDPILRQAYWIRRKGREKDEKNRPVVRRLARCFASLDRRLPRDRRSAGQLRRLGPAVLPQSGRVAAPRQDTGGSRGGQRDVLEIGARA